MQTSRVKELEIQLDEEKHDSEELYKFLRSVLKQLGVGEQNEADTDPEQTVEQEWTAARKKLTVSWLSFSVAHGHSMYEYQPFIVMHHVLFMVG